jgi:hypothetical protein
MACPRVASLQHDGIFAPTMVVDHDAPASDELVYKRLDTCDDCQVEHCVGRAAFASQADWPEDEREVEVE